MFQGIKLCTDLGMPQKVFDMQSLLFSLADFPSNQGIEPGDEQFGP
jgi:hypothetical protein